MPSCSQVTNVVREEVVAGAGKKGFFRRIAEKMGLAQKEVAECRGKSLNEMAEMTSKKDVVEIGKNLKDLEEKIIATGRDEYRKKQELIQIKGSISSLERELQTGNNARYIEELEKKVEQIERRIRFEEPYKGSNGYSPDGDHVYGGYPAESDSHFKQRINRMIKEELEPKQNELKRWKEMNYDIPGQIEKLKQKEQDLISEIAQLRTQEAKDIETYRQLAKSSNYHSAYNDNSIEVFWRYDCKTGKFLD